MVMKRTFLLVFSFIIVFTLSSCTVYKERFMIFDKAGLLSSGERETLQEKVSNYYDKTSNEIIVIIIDSLKGEKMEDYVNRMGFTLRISQEKGILIVVSKKDRRTELRVARGLAQVIPDEKCQALIDNYALPNFKEEKFFQGLEEMIDQIIKSIESEAEGAEKTASLYSTRLTRTT